EPFAQGRCRSRCHAVAAGPGGRRPGCHARCRERRLRHALVLL
ncbi:MAG: hypothetical protein AVDCRST_MAG06-139, partial [uncultured Nocardioides sp.]